jgi:uncharacterized protein
VGCHQVNEKKVLVRLVRTSEGIVIDPGGRLAGRGAYLHDNKECWAKGLKGSLANALKTDLTESDREMIRSYMANLSEDPETKSVNGQGANE